ncbi:MAG: hypothetical protein LWY06_04725 [Firmicutes bacterium]|nr:hypothetical protein [Bacillota bacterium]
MSLQLLPGTKLKNDRYQIIKTAAWRDTGGTYEAWDIAITDKRVIIKEVIIPKMDDEEYNARVAGFTETMEFITHIEHPNLAKVIDHFVESKRAYAVIKFIDGITVEQFVGVIEKLEETQVARIGDTLADAVQFLWNRPRPLSFETIDIEHVMVDLNKNITFMGYDFTQFFFGDFPYSSYADSPEVIEQSIHKISKIMFFLLGGGRDIPDERVPSDLAVSEAMRKLLMVTLNPKQKSYSTLPKFREELEKICDPERKAREEKDYIRRVKKIREEIPTLDGLKKVPGRVFRAVIGQKTWILVLEILFILFLIGLSVIRSHTEKIKYAKPTDTSVVYIASQDELLTLREDDFQIVDKRSYGCNINNLCFVKNEKWQFLALIDSAGGRVVIVNPRDNAKIAEIPVDRSPSKAFVNKDNSLLVVFHKENNSLTLINAKTLQIAGIIPVGADCQDAAFCQGKNTFVITNGNSQDILWVNPDKRSGGKSLKAPFMPGVVAVSPDGAFLCVADEKEDSVKMLEPETGTDADEKKFQELTETGGKVLHSMLWDALYYRVWLIFTDTNNIVLYNLSEKKALKNYKLGTKPVKAVWGRDRKKLWIINEGSKELLVLDPETGRCDHRSVLDKTPGDMETSRD